MKIKSSLIFIERILELTDLVAKPYYLKEISALCFHVINQWYFENSENLLKFDGISHTIIWK